MFNITINGRCHQVNEGTRVITACHAAGVEIPTLCWLQGQPHFTSCMICVVKDIKRELLIPACSARVTDGMAIETNTEEVHDARRVALELLLSEHVGDCLAPCQRVCPLHLDIPQMIRQIAAGDFKSAAQTVARAQTETGIVCDDCKAPCEKACRRGRADETVAIRRLIEVVAKTTEVRLKTEDQRPKTLKHERPTPNFQLPTSKDLQPATCNLEPNRFDNRLGPLQDGELDEFLAGADKGPQVQPANDSYTPEEAAQESARCLRCDCRKPANCKLRQLADRYGAKQSRYKGEMRDSVEINRDHPDIVFEPGKCIKCGICTRIAEAAGEQPGLTFLSRGMETKVGVPFGDGLDRALTRETALHCADACPTAALARREANDPH